MDSKIKHLEMIQAIIARMAHNSFLLKGWTITFVAALIALLAKTPSVIYLVLVFFPIFTFWLLDGFFVRQERLFICLYNEVRLKDLNLIDFNMDTSVFNNKDNKWFRVTLSHTLLTFYGGILLAAISLLIIVA